MRRPKQDQWKKLAVLTRAVAPKAAYGYFVAVLSSVAVLWGLTSTASPNPNGEGVGASVHFALDRPESPATKIRLGQPSADDRESASSEANEPDLMTQLNSWTFTASHVQASSQFESAFKGFDDPRGGDHRHDRDDDHHHHHDEAHHHHH